MSISITQAARQRINQFALQDPANLGLRFGVKKVGCSGWQYVVDMTKVIQENDTVFDLDGVRIVVDQQSLAIVDGTEIDFKREGLNATFAFNNPNVTGACGCGESFSVERQAI
jgi:iron-sulfur cluster assembly protein